MRLTVDDSANDEGIFPLLFRSATPRTGSPEIPGGYDPELALWVIGTGENRIPIIHASDVDLLEITTKTKVNQEVDDEAMTPLVGKNSTSSLNLRELLTKTDVVQESDDTMTPSNSLVELETKTELQPEKDDAETICGFLELVTKTEAQVEHDDDSRPIL